MSNVTVKITKNGPILITERVEVVDQATGKTLEIDKFPIALCRCGKSANKPYCDGEHSKCGFDGTLA